MIEIKDLGFGVIEIFDKDIQYAPAQSIKIGNTTYIREDLINKQISDLQHRLNVAEKALKSMSADYLSKYCSDYCGDTGNCKNCEYEKRTSAKVYKEKAEKELKGE